MKRQIVVICGPTAVGKTKFAIEAAKHIGGEIISCDSMQLYRFMDIGSAKPTPEERQQAVHYLVDEIDPREKFSVADYQKLARSAIETVFSHENIPVIAGGTGLYLNSLLYEMDFSAPPGDESYREALFREAEEKGVMAVYDRLQEADPEAADRIHPNNVKKVIRALEAAEAGDRVRDFATDPVPVTDYDSILIGLTRDREELYDRINCRVDVLMEMGLLSEVDKLLSMGLTASDISMKGIGYKELIGYRNGEYPLEEAVRLIKRNTRHLAKRQMTWFKRYDTMKWIDLSRYPSDEEAVKEINQWLDLQIKK